MDQRSPPYDADLESFSCLPVLAGSPSLPSHGTARNFRVQDLVVHSILSSYPFFYFYEDLPVEDWRGIFLDGSMPPSVLTHQAPLGIF